MFPQLDKATLKTGDYSKILAILDGDYKGAAETVANNDPWTRLKIQFGEVSESLGRVLLPVVIEFTNYLINNVIPKMEEWIELNRTGLQDSLKEVLKLCSCNFK